jgi:hypothetical protein
VAGTRRQTPHPPPPTPRERLDDWHPTLVRYGGFGLIAYALASGQWKDNPELIPAAVGMIYYKKVAGG